jgi:hypothetical protein
MYPIIFSLIVNLSTIMAYAVASVFFFGVITFVTVCTEVDATQERSHTGNHIVVVEGHEQWNSIRQSRRIQEELALELHTKAGVPLHRCRIEDVKTFQRFLVGYQIHVISREHFNGIIYHGPTAEKKIYL